MIAKYLERLGDHAVNICEWVQFYKTGMHKSERILSGCGKDVYKRQVECSGMTRKQAVSAWARCKSSAF